MCITQKQNIMKKLILAAIFCLFAATSFAQNNALGIRAGGGAELQYERLLNSGNVLKVNAGMFDFDGSFFGTVVHNWEICNLGIAGDVAFGIHFNAPITLAIDYRPTVLFLNDAWGKGFGNWGISCVFHF